MNQLRVLVADRSGVSEHVFRNSPVVLGRLPTNEIQLNDPRASRIHAELSWAGETLTVRDMGSGNRTLIVNEVNEHANRELFSSSAQFASGEVELQVGDTTVRAHIERVRVAFVPNEVVGAAKAAAEHLREVRTAAHPSHAGPGTPERASELVEAVSAGLSSLRRALQAGPPGGARVRTAQPPDAATNALLTWTHEAMAAMASVAFALTHVTPVSVCGGASANTDLPSGVQLSPEDDVEAPSAGTSGDAERTTSVTRRPKPDLARPRPLR